MLEMRPGCECRDVDLPPDSAGARLCSFECTFCSRMRRNAPGTVPKLRRRSRGPTARPALHLEKNPASTKRVVKPGGCAA
jgi:uncharacterized protein